MKVITFSLNLALKEFNNMLMTPEAGLSLFHIFKMLSPSLMSLHYLEVSVKYFYYTLLSCLLDTFIKLESNLEAI